MKQAGKVRIIGGNWRGRKIPVSDTQGLRPTPDRVRETLFNWLQATIPGASCLDMFAGSGALGIEAVSRGAASSVLIEQDSNTTETLLESLKILGADNIVVHQADALRWVKTADQVFDIIFLDPPFGKNMIEQSLSVLAESECVGKQTLIYVESEGVWQPEKNVEVIKQAKAGQVHYMLLKKRQIDPMKITAIYPGTFDPITHGHVDIISRASRIFDKVFLAIADSTSKQTLFSIDERMDLARSVLLSLDNIEVCHFDKLVTDVARDLNAKVIIRGIRAAADFDYEFQMAGMNRSLYKEAESIFLRPAEHLSFISSSLVREISSLGGDVSAFVHEDVLQALTKKFSE